MDPIQAVSPFPLLKYRSQSTYSIPKENRIPSIINSDRKKENTIIHPYPPSRREAFIFEYLHR